jgi:hypothetical protein
MNRPALAVLLVGLCATAGVAAPPNPKDLAIPPQELAKARELVKRLGSEVYQEREDAFAELAKMGRLARPALLDGVRSDPDPEVRSRCSRLLPKAGADDLKARIDTFLADTEEKHEHELPGLKQFRKQVGTDKAARDLFIEIIKNPHNRVLLKALDKSPAEAGRAIVDARIGLFLRAQEQRKPIPLTEVACIVFVESLISPNNIPRCGGVSEVPLVLFIDEKAGIGADRKRVEWCELCQRIIAKWMESRGVNNLDHLRVLLGPGGR